MVGEGAGLLWFSTTSTATMAIVAMITFGLFTHMACGATYALVPFIDRKSLGGVAGIIGAGGNVGAVAAGFLLKSVGSVQSCFSTLGFFVLGASACAIAVRFSASHKAKEQLLYDQAIMERTIAVCRPRAAGIANCGSPPRQRWGGESVARHSAETHSSQKSVTWMRHATLTNTLPAQPACTRDWLALNFALTVFVSAFLLFQIEPLISKFILPWFGGSPAVWTTCLLFFQVVLFCGYAYAHLSTRFLAPKWRVIVHIALLVVALSLLHVAPGDQYKPLDAAQPTTLILRLLLATVGLPYFALSATGPLLQAWFSDAYPQRSPYRLYALSNLGSLIALLSYPFVFEPAFDVLTQARLWSWVFAGFSLLCGLCAFKALPALRGAVRAQAVRSPLERSTWAERVRWIGLPACASLALLATTNHVTSDVAVIPFLWVVPLSLYLISFIVAFDHERWYRRRLFAGASVISCLAVGCLDPLSNLLEALHYEVTFVDLLVLHFAALFSVCMLCHGELVRSRPTPSRLTEFYLSISAGGALGGVFVSLIAPAIFATFFEWPLSLLVSFALAVAVLGAGAAGWRASHAARRWGAGMFALVGLVAIVHFQGDEDTPLEVRRNFYGVVSVYDVDVSDPARHHFSLAHGLVVHGRQFVAPEKTPAADRLLCGRYRCGPHAELLSGPVGPAHRRGRSRCRHDRGLRAGWPIDSLLRNQRAGSSARREVLQLHEGQRRSDRDRARRRALVARTRARAEF